MSDAETQGSARSDADPVLEYGRHILGETRAELTRADTKAALLLASVGVVTGALLAAFLSDNWSPNDLANRAEWLWWIGAVSLIIGIVALGYAVYPRTNYRGRSSSFIAYFGDIVATADDQLEERLEATMASPRRPLVDQLNALAYAADKKYRAVQLALWCLALAGAASMASVFLNMTA